VAGSYDGVEPVLRVDVVKLDGPFERWALEVEGEQLPAEFSSRSEALRIAERMYSLLVDGFEKRWENKLRLTKFEQARAEIIAALEREMQQFVGPTSDVDATVETVRASVARLCDVPVEDVTARWENDCIFCNVSLYEMTVQIS
jgi:hypothetical protein